MSENTIKLYTCMPNDWPMKRRKRAIKEVILGISPAFRDEPMTPDMEPDPHGIDVCLTITLEEMEQPAHEHLKDAE